MVTMHVITTTALASDLLLQQLLHLYADRQEAIQTTDRDEEQLWIKFDSWSDTASARDFMEQFGERYNVQDIEWL